MGLLHGVDETWMWMTYWHLASSMTNPVAVLTKEVLPRPPTPTKGAGSHMPPRPRPVCSASAGGFNESQERHWCWQRPHISATPGGAGPEAAGMACGWPRSTPLDSEILLRSMLLLSLTYFLPRRTSRHLGSRQALDNLALPISY